MKKKYIMSQGLALGEEKDMEKLKSYAAQGWMLDGFAPFGFWLKKGRKQHLIFAVDYCHNPDEEYFAYFEAAGWTPVCSAGSHIHIFSAPAGTEPIYSDYESTFNKYAGEKKKCGRIALPALIATMFLSFLSQINSMPFLLTEMFIYTGFAAIIILIFSGMPYLGYTYKLKKLKEG
ncbi:DUF2812 domain-containing protein [Halobacillus kuroshimensis]|uniref:DUF2812 domain-containing protein n=1 Tax=Halobacillus kuroshimensis TaxID=302481 RepID=UPI00042898E1|nr:DUF2812 domain-containing protein [Halobacillus kuroshimensis]